MTPRAAHELWDQVWHADDVNVAYFATAHRLPGAVMFTAERDDAPEFDVARIHRVSRGAERATIHAIVQHYARRGRCPRMQLGPLLAAAWDESLRQSDFVRCAEALDYFSIPRSVRLPTAQDVRVLQVESDADAESFSTVQAAGFGLSPEHHAWDLELVHRHRRSGCHTFYMAMLAGQVVGAARRAHLPDGTAVLAALATLPAARGRGVGTSILARMIDDAWQAGARIVCGAVDSGSEPARMYRRLGFQTLFTTPFFALSQVPVMG